MAEYRAMRLICKHFGFHGDYVEDEMEFGRFWCYLAEALDAEELQDYRDVLLAGGKDAKKKWKWATQDHAGTRPVATKSADVNRQIITLATMLSGGKLEPTGNINEYAKVRGLQKVFQDENGNLYDENMNPIESKAGLVFVPAGEKVH